MPTNCQFCGKVHEGECWAMNIARKLLRDAPECECGYVALNQFDVAVALVSVRDQALEDAAKALEEAGKRDGPCPQDDDYFKGIYEAVKVVRGMKGPK